MCDVWLDSLRTMSRFVRREVRGPLAAVVSAIWWYAASDPTGRETALPSGLSQLLVNLSDQRGVAFAGTEGVLVQGAGSRPSSLWRADQARIAGASFHAGGLRALLGPAVADLADQDVPLEAVLPHADAERLRARLAATPSPDACLDALHDELLALCVRPLDLRVGRAVRGLRNGSIAAVARDLELSERRLPVWFSEQVGLRPKRFARVRRFQRVLEPILSGADLGEVAHACGYYDQAHMNRDFRAFSGVSPTEYRARQPAFPNHLPDDGSVQSALVVHRECRRPSFAPPR